MVWPASRAWHGSQVADRVSTMRMAVSAGLRALFRSAFPDPQAIRSRLCAVAQLCAVAPAEQARQRADDRLPVRRAGID